MDKARGEEDMSIIARGTAYSTRKSAIEATVYDWLSADGLNSYEDVKDIDLDDYRAAGWSIDEELAEAGQDPMTDEEASDALARAKRLMWVEACRVNESEDETLEDWICRALNATEASVDKDGDVRVTTAGHRTWLDAMQWEQMRSAVDRGV